MAKKNQEASNVSTELNLNGVVNGVITPEFLMGNVGIIAKAMSRVTKVGEVRYVDNNILEGIDATVMTILPEWIASSVVVEVKRGSKSIRRLSIKWSDDCPFKALADIKEGFMVECDEAFKVGDTIDITKEITYKVKSKEYHFEGDWLPEYITNEGVVYKINRVLNDTNNIIGFEHLAISTKPRYGIGFIPTLSLVG